MIVRGPRRADHFTILPNETLRDQRLTFKARGLLVFLLSQPPGYRVSSERIAADAKEGRDAIRGMLRELEAAGYLRRERHRCLDGTFVTDAVVYDEPTDQPATGNTSLVPPAETRETAGRTGDWESDAGRSGDQKGLPLEGLEGRTVGASAPPSAEIVQIRRDLVWEALVAVCGMDPASITKTARGQLNRACSELKAVGATPDDIAERAAVYRQVFAGMSLTASALVKHWPQLATAARPKVLSASAQSAMRLRGLG